MFNSGQDCASIERVYVEDSVADAFLAKLAVVVGRMRVADGQGAAELGPLQNARQLEIVTTHVNEAVDKGALVVTGGEPTGVGYGFLPTILDRCTHEMAVMTEETFGPVVAICRVSSAQEAVQRANDCNYGLNGSVWTKDVSRGEQIARQLEVGVALVNNHAFTGTVPQTPWTGVKILDLVSRLLAGPTVRFVGRVRLSRTRKRSRPVLVPGR